MVRTVSVVPELLKPDKISSILRILEKQLRKRCGARIVQGQAADFTVVLGLDGSIARKGFRITDLRGGIRIQGSDERGLLYGVGKFLRTS